MREWQARTQAGWPHWFRSARADQAHHRAVQAEAVQRQQMGVAARLQDPYLRLHVVQLERRVGALDGKARMLS